MCMIRCVVGEERRGGRDGEKGGSRFGGRGNEGKPCVCCR
jgi:hypothetical protein